MNIPIFYINLDRSENRNIRMIQELDKIDVDYYRIQGIDSQNINKNALTNGECQGHKYFIKPNLSFKPRSKEIAIILSHLKALNEMINNNFEIAIIMEDDISFQYINNWNETICKIITSAPSDWKIIKMHTSAPKEIIENINYSNRGINYISLNIKALQSAGCYIIKKNTAIEILKKYIINDVYTFPFKNEYVVCECIIFSVSNIYMYTIPYICAVDNNITCVGNLNYADQRSNEVIHNYWEKNGKFIDSANKSEQNFIKIEKFKFQSVKKLLIKNRDKK